MVFIAIFILGALAILTAGHYFIYLSFVKFFEITGRKYKKILAGLLIFFSLSFIASTLLLYYFQYPFFKFYYGISQLWIGLAFYLLLFFVPGWILRIFSRYVWHQNLNLIIGLLAVLGALVMVVYGVESSRRLEVTNVSVPINGLSPAWQSKEAVQISDVHLGAIHSRPYMQRIVDIINEIGPDIIFITGDLLDGTSRDHDDFLKPLNDIRAPDGIYFVTGNHEVYIGIDKVKSDLSTVPIKFMEDGIIEVDGMQIVGANYPLEGLFKDLSPVLDKVDKSKPAILLYHEPVHTEAAKNAGIDLQLSGHTHKGQLFPINFITRWIYGKYHAGLNSDGNYSIYTCSGTGTWGPPMRTSGNEEIVAIEFYDPALGSANP